MIRDCLKLTVYFGESDRAGSDLLADALFDAFERESIDAAVLLRGTEGFGIKQQVHTGRLLTLSEDLPLVAVAVDEPERIERLLPVVRSLVTGGLVTVERARLAAGRPDVQELPPGLGETVKLSVSVGRTERAAGGLAHLETVALLHRHGLDGATALLGLDGMVDGRRRRGRFFSRNADVPVVIVATGSRDAVASAAAALGRLLQEPRLTLERVDLCKRAGRTIAPPRVLADGDGALDRWQKLTIYADEDARHDGRSLYLQLVRRLRAERALGATALRGIWGFSDGGEPHGDPLLALRRRVPVVTTVIDRPSALQRWWPVVDELTAGAGLVTCEVVPAFHAVGPEVSVGGLRLARPQR